jgi:hypothetical protein
MVKNSWVLVIAVLVLVLLSGCQDKAKSSFDACVTAEAKEDWLLAVQSCQGATMLDPNSKSGKAAAEKLLSLKTKLAAKDRADAEAQATKAKAAAERRAAEAVQQEAVLAVLKAKVHTSSLPARLDYESDKCVSDGKPPKGLEFSGGTYAENEQVALARGCVHAHYVSTQTGPDPSFNNYCCPK